ncbi:MAG TPA: tetratricopeptide repeat protein [Vicinamibacteria bacterium]|nr:tetratricopeptide repeat protein [Vicinamibacteria bacterium]
MSLRGRRLLLVAVLAASVRATHLVAVAQTPMVEYQRVFAESDMFMFHEWAQRIAGGDVLGRVTFHPLTRWQLEVAPPEKWERWYGGARPVYNKAPFYAYLLGALYSVFGDSALPMLLLQVAASTAAVALLFVITEGMFGASAALFAAALFALHGPSVHYDALLLRGPWIVLAALLVTWRLMRAEGRAPLAEGLWLGAAVGGAILVNEGFVPLLALTLAVAAWRWGRPARGRGALGYALGLAALLGPLLLRNLAVGAPPFSIAVMGTAAFAFFNGGTTDPLVFGVRPASYRALLEAGDGNALATVTATLASHGTAGQILRFYAERAAGFLIPFEFPDNVNFYYAALRSPLLRLLPGHTLVMPLALVGVAVGWRQLRQAVILAPVLLTLTASIMLTVPVSRYRATWTVVLLPLAGLALDRMARWAAQRDVFPVLLALLATALLALAGRGLEERLLGRAVTAATANRDSEFRVSADVYARRGQWRSAVRELEDLAARTPDRAVRQNALWAIAAFQHRRGDVAAARNALERILAAGPRAVEVEVRVGDAYAALGDVEGARRSYERALAAGPSEPLQAVLRQKLSALPGTR